MPFHYKDESLSFFGENNPWNPTENTHAIFGQNAGFSAVNPLNAELNPIWHLLALLVTHDILHVSGVRVKPDGNFSYPLSFIKV